jgi:hypothetical protein
MITTEIINGVLCYVQKRATVKYIDGKRKQVLITRLLDPSSLLPVEVIEKVKEILTEINILQP